MQCRLAPAEGDDASAELSQFVDPPEHFRRGNRSGISVKFVAIGARKITAPDGNNLRENRMGARGHGPGKHPRFSPSAMHSNQSPHKEETYSAYDRMRISDAARR